MFRAGPAPGGAEKSTVKGCSECCQMGCMWVGTVGETEAGREQVLGWGVGVKEYEQRNLCPRPLYEV